MHIKTGPVSPSDALQSASELEKALGEIANGERKLEKLPLEPVMRLIQFTRVQAAPLPEGKRERMAFYESAMKDPKNHGALALELTFLRSKVDEQSKVSA